MADPCTEQDRITRIEGDVSKLNTGVAVMGANLESMCRRQDEHHAAQLGALGEVKADNTALSVELLNEVRANRPSDPLKNPKVLGLIGLLIVALAAPQLLLLIVPWALAVPVAELVEVPEVEVADSVTLPEQPSPAPEATPIETATP